jgi:hypothetical protein
LEELPEASGVDWETLGDMETLRAFNDTIYYVLPKLLLVTTAFYELSFGSIQGNIKPEEEQDSSKTPPGVARGTKKVQMVKPDEAPANVKRLFASIKETHKHPLVSSYYRGLANWPDFLEEAWKRIQPLVGSAVYEERKQGIIKQAQSDLSTLSLPEIKPIALEQEQRAEIKAILLAFQHKFIPEMLLDVALIKAMLDGKEEASFSRFSVAGKS